MSFFFSDFFVFKKIQKAKIAEDFGGQQWHHDHFYSFKPGSRFAGCRALREKGQSKVLKIAKVKAARHHFEDIAKKWLVIVHWCYPYPHPQMLQKWFCFLIWSPVHMSHMSPGPQAVYHQVPAFARGFLCLELRSISGVRGGGQRPMLQFLDFLSENLWENLDDQLLKKGGQNLIFGEPWFVMFVAFFPKA